MAIATKVGVTLLIAIVLGGCGGSDEGADEQPTVTTSGATTIAAIRPDATETTAGEGDATAGEQVFADAGCGDCHTLAAAGTDGKVGPDLDVLRPTYEAIVSCVTYGIGQMPAFGEDGTLTTKQIQDVAVYVFDSTSEETAPRTNRLCMQS